MKSHSLPISCKFDDEFLFVTASAKLGAAQSPLPIEKIDPDQLLLQKAVTACVTMPSPPARS